MCKALAFFAALMAAGPASALSCMKVNFADTFDRILVAPELYSLAYGQIIPLETVPTYVAGQPRTVRYKFEGRINFRGERQTKEFTVTTGCASAWCGALPDAATPLLMFLEHREDRLHLRSQECSADFFQNPGFGQVTAIKTCLRKRGCSDAERAAFE